MMACALTRGDLWPRGQKWLRVQTIQFTFAVSQGPQGEFPHGGIPRSSNSGTWESLPSTVLA